MFPVAQRSAANERDELFDRDAGFADQGTQRALGDFAVVGNCEAPVRRLRMPQDDVAASLPIELVPELSERGGNLAA
jgi:hypothetical protein